jgi:hypothetical protein
MAFCTIKELLLWYAESHAIIKDLKDRKEFDSSCALTRMLDGLVSFYDPRPLISEQYLIAVYRRLYGLDDDGCVEGDDYDEDDVNIDDCRGVADMVRQFKADGRIAKAMGLRDMADILGYNPKAFRWMLSKNTPPIQYAWRAGTARGRGRWRFAVDQVDNFKRWMANLGKLPPQPREIEPGRSTHEAGGQYDGPQRGNVYEMEDAEYGCPSGDF